VRYCPDRRHHHNDGPWRVSNYTDFEPPWGWSASTEKAFVATTSAFSAAAIALEISRRNARVAALQERWDLLRADLELLLDQRGADMADVPGGASGLLVRDYKGKEADVLVTRIDPGVVALVAELRGHGRQAVEELAQWKTVVEERRTVDASPAAVTLAAG
jgi:hypothetical protein